MVVINLSPADLEKLENGEELQYFYQKGDSSIDILRLFQIAWVKKFPDYNEEEDLDDLADILRDASDSDLSGGSEITLSLSKEEVDVLLRGLCDAYRDANGEGWDEGANDLENLMGNIESQLSVEGEEEE